MQFDLASGIAGQFQIACQLELDAGNSYLSLEEYVKLRYTITANLRQLRARYWIICHICMGWQINAAIQEFITMTKKKSRKKSEPAISQYKSNQSPFLYEKSWALLVGINNYKDIAIHPLANAANDAEALAELLKTKYDFNIFLLINDEARREAIMELLIDQLPREMGSNDRLIFFFSGHSVTSSTGNAYIIPQDAQEGHYSQYIDMEELRNALSRLPAKQILLILDCAYSAMAARTISVKAGHSTIPVYLPSGYSRVMELSKGRSLQIIAASGSYEQLHESADLPGHSAFTAALLDGLKGHADLDGDGEIAASDLYKYVNSHLISNTGQIDQWPLFSQMIGSLGGEFVFHIFGFNKEIKAEGPSISRSEIKRYNEFIVEIKRLDDRYRVRLVSSYGDFVERDFLLPIGIEDIQLILSGVPDFAEDYAMRRAYKYSRSDPIIWIGGLLFSSLFEGRGEILYRQAKSEAERQKKGGLRLRFITDDAQINAMPWEFLYDSTLNSFINLSDMSSIARTPKIRRIKPFSSEAELDMAVIASHGIEKGNIPIPMEIIDDYLERLMQFVSQGGSQRLRVKILKNPTFADLNDAIDDQLDILHFIDLERSLEKSQSLRAPDGEESFDPKRMPPITAPINFNTLMYLVKSHPELRLVYVYANASSQIAYQLAEICPYAIGFQGNVSNSSVWAFTESLFKGILAGLPLEAAVAKGRQHIALQNPGTREWGLPVLFLTDPDIKLFSMEKSDEDIGSIEEGALKFETLKSSNIAKENKEVMKAELMLSIQRQNLQSLEKKKAASGDITLPYTQSQIDDTLKKIAQIEKQLAQISQEKR